MKYSVAAFLVGIVFISNSTFSENREIIPQETVSPLDRVYNKYSNGYFSARRYNAISEILSDDKLELKIKQLLFTKISLLRTLEQTRKDTESHAELQEMLAYIENELYILGVQSYDVGVMRENGDK